MYTSYYLVFFSGTLPPTRRNPKAQKERQREVALISSSEDEQHEERETGDNAHHPHKGSQEAARADIIWNVINHLWDFDERPEDLQCKEKVALLSLEDIKRLKEIHNLEQGKPAEKKNAPVRNKKPKEVSFPEDKDNCFDTLHPARWLRLPLEEHKQYWPKVPVKRNEIYLSMDLEFTGENS